MPQNRKKLGEESPSSMQRVRYIAKGNFWEDLGFKGVGFDSVVMVIMRNSESQ